MPWYVGSALIVVCLRQISNVMATHDSAFQKLRENATLIALLKSAFVKDLSAKSRAEKIKQNEEEAKQRLEQRLAEIDKDGNGISVSVFHVP